jgi:ribonuclease HII
MPADLAAFDASYRPTGSLLAGVDEAGRGCLAGPVVAAAVVLPPGCSLPGLDDSKKLTPHRREALFEALPSIALGIGVGMCSPGEIDRLNILHAAMEAMRRAIEGLEAKPDRILIDGNRLPPRLPAPAVAVVKGDAQSQSIAAASVVAKVTRDRLMAALHAEFAAYDWQSNKGYPTRAHYAALATHGPTPHHRRSFRLAER